MSYTSVRREKQGATNLVTLSLLRAFPTYHLAGFRQMYRSHGAGFSEHPIMEQNYIFFFLIKFVKTLSAVSNY